MSRLPLDEAVAAIMAHLESGTFERWVPESFRELYVKRALDPDTAVAAAAGWFNELERQVVASPGPT
jgi:hypothetical protein